MRDTILGIIGKPWAIPCDPPNSFDCWELVRYVREREGRPTPIGVPKDQRLPKHRKHFYVPPKGWTRLLLPVPFCVVRIGPSHVGLYLSESQIVHAQRNTGVRIDPLRVLGRDITFWEYDYG